MAANFTTNGNNDIREYMIATYKNIGLFNGSSVEIARLTGSKATWVNVNGDGNDYIIIEAVVKGDGTTDAAVTVGTTIAGIKLFKSGDTAVGSGSSIVDVTYASPFTFQNSADQLTVQIKVTVPGV